MTDDPHDAFHPVIRDGVWWCEKHDMDAENCPCGRDGDPVAAILISIIVALILFLIVAAIWLL